MIIQPGKYNFTQIYPMSNLKATNFAISQKPFNLFSPNLFLYDLSYSILFKYYYNLQFVVSFIKVLKNYYYF